LSGDQGVAQRVELGERQLFLSIDGQCGNERERGKRERDAEIW
jgi:hypothetical protein